MKVASTSSCSLLLSALFLLGAAVQHTLADDTCTVWVLNKAYQGLTVDSYNQNDGLCLDYYTSTSMDYDTLNYFQCQGSSCKMKVAGANNCDGTVEAACDMYMVFYVENGDLTYCISSSEFCEDSRRQLVQKQELEPEVPKTQRLLRRAQ